MIVVKIELHSAITGKLTNLGSMIINNDGTGTNLRGNYRARMYKSSKRSVLNQHAQGHKPIRDVEIKDHPRESQPVQSLVLKALKAMGY